MIRNDAQDGVVLFSRPKLMARRVCRLANPCIIAERIPAVERLVQHLPFLVHRGVIGEGFFVAALLPSLRAKLVQSSHVNACPLEAVVRQFKNDVVLVRHLSTSMSSYAACV